MGCDIHSFAEVKKEGKWVRVMEPLFKGWNGNLITEPFENRNYSVFSFLAGVRNYSDVTPLSLPKGLPDDSEWLNQPHEYAYEVNPMSGLPIPYKERETNRQYLENDINYHSHSHFTLLELLSFDYSKQFENRRISKTTFSQNGSVLIDGRAKSEIGEGTIQTYRQFLGFPFFEDLNQLQIMGDPEDVRIVFWFDN